MTAGIPVRTEDTQVLNANESCRGDCSGYGSRCCCPPLIVLAMRSGRVPSHALDQACHDGRTAEVRATQAMHYFAAALASNEFCSCTTAYHAQQAGLKMKM